MTVPLNRRQLVTLLAAAPALAQTSSPVPPLGAPAPAAPNASPDVKLAKAQSDVQANSAKLQALSVPMNIEPAFTFKI